MRNIAVHSKKSLKMANRRRKWRHRLFSATERRGLGMPSAGESYLGGLRLMGSVYSLAIRNVLYRTLRVHPGMMQVHALKPEHPMRLTKKRVLFVDDEPGIRHTLPLILRRYGFTVMVAGTVTEALDQIKAQPIDVLLCDLNLEREHDGFDVVRAARNANLDVVVIILTAYPDVDSAIKGIHEQVDEYIVKPSDPDTLVAILANTLAKRTGQTVLSRPPQPLSDIVQ